MKKYTVEGQPGDSTTKPESKKTNHLKLHRFQKGVSGNPSGRPKFKLISDALEAALEEPFSKAKNSKSCLKMLCTRMVRHALRNPTFGLDLLIEAADRIEGKALARQEFSGKDGGPIEFKQMNREETERRVFELLAKAKLQVVSGKVP
jgi:hypothetical protein